MDADATIRWLTGLRNLGSRLGIERMRALSARLGRPELAAPCFHVAGTNGKGSVCAMIESVQRAHGRLTGLYTSPHLVSVGERIRVGSVPVSEDRVAGLWREKARYEPAMGEDERLSLLDEWHRAVERASGWAQE